MEYLTVKEFAELKECTERYVKRLCKDGKIKPNNILIRRIRKCAI